MTMHDTTVDSPADRQTFDLAGTRLDALNTPATQRVLAAAHADRLRPICLCALAGWRCTSRASARPLRRQADARHRDGPRRALHLLPAAGSVSGLGQVLGDAIQESVETGVTALRFGFRMAKTDRAGAAAAAAGEGQADSVSADGTRLSCGRCCTTSGRKPA